MSIPTILLFKNGEVAHQIVGALPKNRLVTGDRAGPRGLADARRDDRVVRGPLGRAEGRDGRADHRGAERGGRRRRARSGLDPLRRLAQGGLGDGRRAAGLRRPAEDAHSREPREAVEARGERSDRARHPCCPAADAPRGAAPIPDARPADAYRDEAFSGSARSCGPSAARHAGHGSSETSPRPSTCSCGSARSCSGRARWGCGVSAIAGTATARSSSSAAGWCRGAVGVVIGLLVAVNPLLFWYSAGCTPLCPARAREHAVGSCSW